MVPWQWVNTDKLYFHKLANYIMCQDILRVLYILDHVEASFYGEERSVREIKQFILDHTVSEHGWRDQNSLWQTTNRYITNKTSKCNEEAMQWSLLNWVKKILPLVISVVLGNHLSGQCLSFLTIKWRSEATPICTNV